MAAPTRNAIRKKYFREAAFLYLFEEILALRLRFLLPSQPMNWCKVPKGHTHPQKNLPRIMVRTIVRSAHIRSL